MFVSISCFHVCFTLPLPIESNHSLSDSELSVRPRILSRSHPSPNWCEAKNPYRLERRISGKLLTSSSSTFLFSIYDFSYSASYSRLGFSSRVSTKIRFFFTGFRPRLGNPPPCSRSLSYWIVVNYKLCL